MHVSVAGGSTQNAGATHHKCASDLAIMPRALHVLSILMLIPFRRRLQKMIAGERTLVSNACRCACPLHVCSAPWMKCPFDAVQIGQRSQICRHGQLSGGRCSASVPSHHQRVACRERPRSHQKLSRQWACRLLFWNQPVIAAGRRSCLLTASLDV